MSNYKFDVEKFLAFELGHGMSIKNCIKCAARYALNLEIPSSGVSLYTGLGCLYSPNGSVELNNLFSRKISREFALDMDIAETMLLDQEDRAAIKKFVIDSALKHGLIEEKETAYKQLEVVA